MAGGVRFLLMPVPERLASLADSVGAGLRRAVLRRAKLGPLDLPTGKSLHVNLKRADLRGSDLIGADLDGSDLEDARLDEALADAKTVWPKQLSRAQLIERGVRFSPDPAVG